MIARIEPRPLRGTVKAIASKSQAHRVLIAAALSDRPTKVHCAVRSQDILASAGCLEQMGAKISFADGVYSIQPLPRGEAWSLAQLDVGESGSTLRFLLPILCALGMPARIQLHGRLPERPLSPLWEELERHGAQLSRPAQDCIAVGAQRMQGGTFTLPGDISSQYISGLMLAAPCLEGDQKQVIQITGDLQSESYVTMTRQVMAGFGVSVSSTSGGYGIEPHARYTSPGEVRVEGDWSNAAFFLAGSKLSNGKVRVTGLTSRTTQGDRAIEEILDELDYTQCIIDMRQIPDLLPVLAVVAALKPGRRAFGNAERLRLKESDRLATVGAMLRALGAAEDHVKELPGGLVIIGEEKLRGGVVDSAGDHRIAMAAAIAAIGCEHTVEIHGAECVAKSYPGFWDDYKALHGNITLI